MIDATWSAFAGTPYCNCDFGATCHIFGQKCWFFGNSGLEFLTISRYRCISSIANRERQDENIAACASRPRMRDWRSDAPECLFFPEFPFLIHCAAVWPRPLNVRFPYELSARLLRRPGAGTLKFGAFSCLAGLNSDLIPFPARSLRFLRRASLPSAGTTPSRQHPGCGDGRADDADRVGEVALFQFLGNIVDWLTHADPATFLETEGHKLSGWAR
jgi:hypothetical protein